MYQQLWNTMIQMQSTSWAGLNLWFIYRVILIYTCLVSDTISIDICYILLSETTLGKRDCWLIQLSSSHTVLCANATLGIKRKKQFYEQRQHDSTTSNCEMFSTKKLKIKSSVVCFLATKCSHFSCKLIKYKKTQSDELVKLLFSKKRTPSQNK